MASKAFQITGWAPLPWAGLICDKTDHIKPSLLLWRFFFFFKLNGENIFCRFLKEFPIFKTHCLTQKGKKKRRNVKGKEQRKRLISEIKQFYRLLRDNRQDPEHDRQITTSLCLLLLLLCFKLQKWSTALIKWWKKPTKKPKPKTWQVVTIYSHLSLLSYGW